jgi:glycosyltransferase involved in cell wall biosynthesis
MSESDSGPAVPLIAVVLPTFRSEAVLPAALASLQQQTFRGFEVVISDGASPDGTLAVARAAASALPRLTLDSRPDAGVYDAINRGVRQSVAPWFLVLGSDDRLHAPDTLQRAAEVLTQLPDAAQDPLAPELVYGDVIMVAAHQPGMRAGQRYAGAITPFELPSTNICQQAIFYRRSLFDALGGFDLRYPLYADWAFNLQAGFRRPLQWVDLVVADYSASGLSSARRDEAFIADRPRLVRDGFVAGADKPWLRPHRRRLLRDANWLRRQGRWREAWGHVRAYLQLVRSGR